MFAGNEATCLEGKRDTLTAYLCNTLLSAGQLESLIERAVKIAGLGRQNLRLIPVDERFAMRPEALKRQIQQDRQAGLTPCFVAATVGTTSSNAIDPLPEIGRICREENIWLHVDGAMSGTAALCPEYRWILDGLETADSFAFNPHKWMSTPFDASLLLFRRPETFRGALSLVPEYLRVRKEGEAHDFHEYGIQLGRPPRVPRWMASEYSVRMARSGAPSSL